MQMKKYSFLLLILALTNLCFGTTDKKQLKLRVNAPGGFLDETNLYFDLGVSPIYRPNEDGPKVYNSIPNAPSVYSLSSDNVYCSTNGYSSLSVTEEIALGVKADTTGIHIFVAPIISNFDSTTIIILEDRVLNKFTNLRADYYPFFLSDGEVANNRFYLHITRPVGFTTVTAGCLNNDGAIELNQDNVVVWTALQLYDSAGTLMDSLANISGPYAFNSLSSGNYYLILTYGNYVTSRQLQVNGNYITASPKASTYSSVTNQSIDFFSNAYNATNYEWFMGDSAIIGGVANPNYTFYEPGNFTVILKCTNSAGCEYIDSVTVSISAATGVNDITAQGRKVWSDTKTITAVLNEDLNQNADIKVYNILGQPVFNAPLVKPTTTLSLPEQPTGYYFVVLQNNKLETTQKIFLAHN